MDEFFKTAGMKCAGRFVCTNTSKKDGILKYFVRKMKQALI